MNSSLLKEDSRGLCSFTVQHYDVVIYLTEYCLCVRRKQEQWRQREHFVCSVREAAAWRGEICTLHILILFYCCFFFNYYYFFTLFLFLLTFQKWFLSDFQSQEGGVTGVPNRKYRLSGCIYKSYYKCVIITNDHLIKCLKCLYFCYFFHSLCYF